MILIPFTEVADVLITLGEVQSENDSAAALKSFRSALEIIFFCFGVEHYKYASVSESITMLGGSIPSFKHPIASKKGSGDDWRKALDCLIAQSAPTNNNTPPPHSKNSSNSNTQLLLLALSSGLI